MREQWKGYLSLILSIAEATIKNFLYVEFKKTKHLSKQNTNRNLETGLRDSGGVDRAWVKKVKGQ